MSAKWPLLVCIVINAVSSCLHSSLSFPSATISSQSYVHRRLEESVYQPLRLVPYYDNSSISALSQPDQIFLMQYLMPAAINFWKQALSVIPVADGLLANHDCSITTYGVCQTLVSNQTCGEMIIPEAHFAPKTRCEYCGFSGLCSGCSVITPSNIPIAADMVLYIRATTTTNCSPGVLAYATTCQRDQYDRPTFGTINFCPAYINPSQRAGPIYDKQLTAAKHEIAHALGLSASSFPLMREADGTPRTLRVSGGLFGPTKPMPGICNGATVETISTSFPSNNTIIYRFQRGHYVATMVTPAVSRFVQAFFNCTTLPGADLENNDPACIGSHWEERLFSPESMSPVVNYNGNVFTALTLAFFEDTGWYQPNYSMAEQTSYGMNKGCAFTNDKCILNNTSLDSDVFCTNSSEQCSLNLLSRSYCTRANATASLPPIYQYFSTPTDGGTSAFPDYCPLVSGYSNGDCSFSVNQLNFPSTTISPLGELYGSQSKCVMTSLRQNNMRGYTVSGRYAGCYPMSCNTTTAPPVISISVAQSAASLVTVTCIAKGQLVTVPGFTGTLQCPDPNIVCGQACTPRCQDQAMCINGQCIATKSGPTQQPTPISNVTNTPAATPVLTSQLTTSAPTSEPIPQITPNATQEPQQPTPRPTQTNTPQTTLQATSEPFPEQTPVITPVPSTFQAPSPQLVYNSTVLPTTLTPTPRIAPTPSLATVELTMTPQTGNSDSGSGDIHLSVVQSATTNTTVTPTPAPTTAKPQHTSIAITAELPILPWCFFWLLITKIWNCF